MDYGRDFDFSRSFFEQFYELQLEVPRPALVNNNAENSDYCNFADDNKNCYLITTANDNEDSMYGFWLVENRDIVDCNYVYSSELLYECVDCRKCYGLRHSINCESCRDSAFLMDCKGVSNSILCINLRNQDYHILNKPCTKEEYEQTMKDLKGSYRVQQELLEKFEELKKQHLVRKSRNTIASENVSGNNIYNSKNVNIGFEVYNSEDCSYLHDGLEGVSCHDICFFDGVELCYESTSLMGYLSRFTNFCRHTKDVLYCDGCHNSSNLFGCNGLRSKQYCIFNKQYSKEDYEDLVMRIIEHMIDTKEFGEFPPIKYSPFPYEQTLAHEYFQLENTQEAQNPKSETLTKSKIENPNIPDSISEVSDDICGEILHCEETGKPYKIIPQELKFYRDLSIPIPRKCPDARHLHRNSLRREKKIYIRSCDNCMKEIKTTYSSERSEIVYCEDCYLKTVY